MSCDYAFGYSECRPTQLIFTAPNMVPLTKNGRFRTHIPKKNGFSPSLTSVSFTPRRKQLKSRRSRQLLRVAFFLQNTITISGVVLHWGHPFLGTNKHVSDGDRVFLGIDGRAFKSNRMLGGRNPIL